MRTIANKIKGLTIEIGGETTLLTKSLGEVNKHSRDLKSELKDVERLLKLDPTNTELLAQKQKILAESVDNTKKKLDTLKEAEKQAQEQFAKGEIAEEQYRAIQREVIKTEQELGTLNTKLKEMDWQSITDGLDKFGQKATDIGKKLTIGVTTPIVGAGTAAFLFAADLEDAFGATEQIYKNSANEVKAWADTLNSYYGIAEKDALEYANIMGAMLQNIGGLSEREAAKQSKMLVELAGDLSAMFGGTTESAVQALTGALKGNNTMLDNYGMGVNEATIKTKALEMGLLKGKKELDLAGKQAATLALIMEQTADAQGQAGREAEGASGSMKTLATELKNLATDIGQVLLPIITPLITILKEMVQNFSEMSPTTQKMVVTIALLAAAIGPLLIVIGNMALGVSALIGIYTKLNTAILANVATKVIEKAETLYLIGLYAKDVIAKTLSTAATTAMTVATGIWNVVAGIATAVTTALGAAIAFLTSPIGLAIAAIVLLVGAVVWLWKENEKFRINVIKTWELIKTVIVDVVKAISENWTKALDWTKTTFKNIYETILEWIEKAIDFVKGLPKTMLQIGKDIIQGLIDGIKEKFQELKDGVKDIADSVAGTFKKVLGINSPSRVFRGFGENIGDGLSLGIKDSLSNLKSVSLEMTSAITPNVKSSVSSVSNKTMQDIKQDIIVNIKADDLQQMSDVVRIFEDFKQVNRGGFVHG